MLLGRVFIGEVWCARMAWMRARLQVTMLAVNVVSSRDSGAKDVSKIRWQASRRAWLTTI